MKNWSLLHAARLIFNSHLSVSSGDETLRLMLDILLGHLPSVATDDRKKSQGLNITLNTKTGPLFLTFN